MRGPYLGAALYMSRPLTIVLSKKYPPPPPPPPPTLPPPPPTQTKKPNFFSFVFCETGGGREGMWGGVGVWVVAGWGGGWGGGGGGGVAAIYEMIH